MVADGHFEPGRIRAVRDVAAEVRMIELEPQRPAHPYPTGSHLDVAVMIDQLPDVRSYSLVGEGPVDGAYRIAVKRLPESRGGSIYMHGLEPGARVAISEPQSDFELQYGRPEYLLVAGGIGITPIVGMAAAIARHGAPFRLLYAARTSEQMAFVEELRELCDERLELFVSEAGQRLEIGAAIDRLHPEGELYLCGPARLREATQRAWRERGRPADLLRFETFASGGRFPPERFVIRVAEHDRDVVVAENRTMLDALREADVEMMWDCLRGECGLCVAKVLEVEGQIDHRDVFLSEDEQAEAAMIVTCVSRAVGGSITIDTGYRQEPSSRAGS